MNIAFNRISHWTAALTLLLCGACNQEELLENPNASTRATAAVVLNNLTSNMVLADEMPFQKAHRFNQYYVSNYSYYWGSNFYNWTNTEERYRMLQYSVKLEEEANRQFGTAPNVYQALAKFYRAYSAVWFSQRVGDIPMSEAGNPENLTPKYDTQQQVYEQVIQLLEQANTILAELLRSPASNLQPNALVDSQGDIFRLSYLQWQKAINTFRLRVLVSMSNRATDTPELGVAKQVAELLSNPAKYPIMEANQDNMTYRFNAAYNPLPNFHSRPYSYGANVSKTVLDLTTATRDPRTYIFATPAPAQYRTAKKPIADFSAYVGASTNISQAVLNSGTDTKGSTDEDQGAYSYINYKRYFASQDGSTAEPYVVMGYPELCFNIAEAISRGWAPGSAQEWLDKGVLASLQIYGLTQGQELEVGDRLGNTLGKVTVDVDAFMGHPELKLNGSLEVNLKRILAQKYLALFCNSGYESFYNWLRTGYPEFQQGGEGIGTADGKISRRWMYPVNEKAYNSANYLESIQRQYGGKDLVTEDTWLFKK